MQPLSTLQSLIIVGLFAVALAGFLKAAHQPGKVTRRHVVNVLGFVALVVVDVAILIINSNVHER